MSEHSEHGVLDEAPTAVESAESAEPADDASMAELRSLLLGPAEGQIAEIHSRLTDPQRQLKEDKRRVFYEEVLWALLNSKEFLFNH